MCNNFHCVVTFVYHSVMNNPRNGVMMKSNPLVDAAEMEFRRVTKELEALAVEQLAHKKKGEELEAREAKIHGRQAELSAFFKFAQTLLPSIDVPAGGAVPRPAAVQTTYKNTIEGAAEEILRGRWLHTREIIAELERQGVEVRGDTIQRKVTRIAVLLSQSEKFKTERATGWTLREGKPASPKANARGRSAPRAVVGAAI